MKQLPYLKKNEDPVQWASRLVTALNARDAEIERRLADAEARLTAGGL